uniref:Uncharacterized protein n=1 Tax=Octopus bimaculoides TaxID=37653 RepID=A0A0L8GYT9_OCTBM
MLDGYGLQQSLNMIQCVLDSSPKKTIHSPFSFSYIAIIVYIYITYWLGNITVSLSSTNCLTMHYYYLTVSLYITAALVFLNITVSVPVYNITTLFPPHHFSSRHHSFIFSYISVYLKCICYNTPASLFNTKKNSVWVSTILLKLLQFIKELTGTVSKFKRKHVYRRELKIAEIIIT